MLCPGLNVPAFCSFVNFGEKGQDDRNLTPDGLQGIFNQDAFVIDYQDYH